MFALWTTIVVSSGNRLFAGSAVPGVRERLSQFRGDVDAMGRRLSVVGGRTPTRVGGPATRSGD